MVQEQRKIMLSSRELMLALDAYRRTAPQFLPEGEITYCTIFEHGAVKVGMQNGKKAVHPHHLQAEDLLKPMIDFCIKHKIMLPKAGLKSVRTLRGYAVLCVELHTKVEGDALSIAEEQIASANTTVPSSASLN